MYDVVGGGSKCVEEEKTCCSLKRETQPSHFYEKSHSCVSLLLSSKIAEDVVHPESSLLSSPSQQSVLSNQLR